MREGGLQPQGLAMLQAQGPASDTEMPAKWASASTSTGKPSASSNPWQRCMSRRLDVECGRVATRRSTACPTCFYSSVCTCAGARIFGHEGLLVSEGSVVLC